MEFEGGLGEVFRVETARRENVGGVSEVIKHRQRDAVGTAGRTF